MAVTCSSAGGGAEAAAAFMCLGRLAPQAAEEVVLVLGAEEEERRDGAEAAEAAGAGEVGGRTLVEDDIVLEDYSSEDEGWAFPAGGAEAAAAEGNPMVARRRMQARAQQCVVCMEEKEHTFVPVHADGAGDGVHSHRFCSSCWLDFLDHSLRSPRAQRLRGGPRAAAAAAAVPLSCPICRAAIAAPDVWGVGFELPEAWLRRPGEAEEKHLEAATLPSVTRPAGAGALGPITWADGSSFLHPSGSAAGTRLPSPSFSAASSWDSEGAFSSSALEEAWDAAGGADSGAEADADCTPAAGRGPGAPLCRRVWNAAVGRSALCLRGVIRVAREAVATDYQRIAYEGAVPAA